MKIRFMKQDALDSFKGQLNTIYNYYYTNYNNKWMEKLYGDDPFEDFIEIPDFSLSPLDDIEKVGRPGEIDFENCKILYNNLKNVISEEQACDERLWAGLCNDVFYDYIRKKFRMNTSYKKPKTPEKCAGVIETRYYFKDGVRAGIFRNALAKSWWVGKRIYDSSNLSNPYYKLDIIGSHDLVTFINEVFYNYNFTASESIFNGLVNGIKHFRDNEISFSYNPQLRKTMQNINAIGGGTILDCWSEDEISDLFIDQMNLVLNNNSQLAIEEDDDEPDSENIEDNRVTESEDSEEARYVMMTDDVIVIYPDKTEHKIRMQPTESGVPPLVNALLGHLINDVVLFNGNEYIVKEIKSSL